MHADEAAAGADEALEGSLLIVVEDVAGRREEDDDVGALEGRVGEDTRILARSQSPALRSRELRECSDAVRDRIVPEAPRARENEEAEWSTRDSTTLASLAVHTSDLARRSARAGSAVHLFPSRHAARRALRARRPVLTTTENREQRDARDDERRAPQTSPTSRTPEPSFENPTDALRRWIEEAHVEMRDVAVRVSNQGVAVSGAFE